MNHKQLEHNRHKRVAEELGKGAPISKAMVAAGYSKGQAKRGLAGLPKGVYDAMLEQGVSFRRLGRHFNADQRAEIVRGALVKNVLGGKDKAVRSIELLGRDVAVGVFKADSTVVAVQINLPPGLESMFTELLATTKPTNSGAEEGNE